MKKDILKENKIKTNKITLLIFFIDIILSIMWGIAYIICLTENMIVMANVNLILCIVWSVISMIWQYKKI